MTKIWIIFCLGSKITTGEICLSLGKKVKSKRLKSNFSVENNALFAIIYDYTSIVKNDQLIETVIRSAFSTILYGCESWTISTEDRRRHKTFELSRWADNNFGSVKNHVRRNLVSFVFRCESILIFSHNIIFRDRTCHDRCYSVRIKEQHLSWYILFLSHARQHDRRKVRYFGIWTRFAPENRTYQDLSIAAEASRIGRNLLIKAIKMENIF